METDSANLFLLRRDILASRLLHTILHCVMMMKEEPVDAELPLLETESIQTTKVPPLETERAGQRLELQGLRALAIIGVLLFHQWSSVFKSGYLGVDVFFVISGYLMCHLFSRKMPLESAEIADFYFRRIKRIVPIYLFVVGITALVAKYYISPLDYKQLIDEAVPSIFFFSNFPSVHKVGYFDLRSKYFFLLHTWSLSTEMQFYLLVPALFLVAQRINRTHLIWTLGALLFSVSLLRQFFADGDAKHMPLDGRIWQFLSGFAAHFLFEMLKNKTSEEKSNLKNFLCNQLLNGFVVLVLIILLLFQFTSFDQFVRCLVVLTATMFVVLPNGKSSLLSANILINLGDISYSVYLIHWPIFTLHRFLADELYAQEKEASHIAGTHLITVSILVGYILERFWSQIAKYVRSWGSLCAVLLVLYAVVGIILWDISKSAVRIDDSAVDLSPNPHDVILRDDVRIRDDGAVDKVAKHTEELWATRRHPVPLNTKDALDYNLAAIKYGFDFLSCGNRSAVFPTKLNIPESLIGDVCNEKGNGTKNIVIIGNSHATVSYYGIRRQFSDLAANISLRALPSCSPHPEEYQQTIISAEKRRNCVNFVNSTVEMLRLWDYPVDIVIALYGFGFLPNPEPVKNWETDSLFIFMQDYYRQLSEIAREAVFVPSMNLFYEKSQTKELTKRLLKNETIKEMGETLEKQLKFYENIRHRIEHIKCPKCILMDWHKLWCRADEGKFCQSVEPIRDVSYFLDQHHVSAYGSMFVGEYLRQRYDSLVEKN